MRKTVLSLFVSLFLPLASFAQTAFADTTGLVSMSSGNVAELLLGKVSGVRVSAIDGNPVGELNVHIRGINSLRTDNQPLWIVDGVMISPEINDNLDAFWQYGERSYTSPLNPLSFLNAGDIESIEVIKDISATAIYGSRGANGVIVIRTKLPSSGKKNLALQSNAGVSFSSNAGSPSVSHNHRVAVGNATANTVYNISGTFRNISGVLPENRSNYGSLKGNFDTRANEFLWFGFNTILSAGASSSPTATAWLGAPSYTLALRDAALSPGTSPEQWITDYDDDTEDYRGLFSAYVTMNLAKNLSLTARGGLDFQQNKRVIWYGKSTDLGGIAEDNLNGGAASVLSSMLLGYNGDVEVKYNRYFGNNHRICATLTAQTFGYSDKFNTMNSNNFVTHELRGKGMAMGNSPRNNRIFARSYFHLGAFALLQYSWNEVVDVKGLVRADTTPKYKSAVRDIYPAAEASLNLHKLLMSSARGVSALKLCAGWGRSGKEKYVPYELFGNYLTSDWFRPESGVEAFYDGMDRLTTTEFHIGGKIGFVQNRLNLSLTYYNRETADHFQMFCNGIKTESRYPSQAWKWADPAEVFGRSSAVANRGIETELDAVILSNSKVKWTLSANGAYNINQMTSSNVEDFPGKIVGHDIYCSCNAIDLPISSLYGYRADAAGNYLDSTGEGYVSTADKVILGNTIPVFHGGLQTSLQIGRLVAQLQVDGAAGHSIANIAGLVRDGKLDSQGKVVLSSNYVEPGDFLRLGMVGLSYLIPLKASSLKSLSVNLSARNLCVLSRYSGWNPDVNSFGVSTLSNGFDYGSYPLVRSVFLGIIADF